MRAPEGHPLGRAILAPFGWDKIAEYRAGGIAKESYAESAAFLNEALNDPFVSNAIISALTIPVHGVNDPLIVNAYSLGYEIYPILAAQNY